MVTMLTITRVKSTGEIVDGKAIVSFNGDDFYLDELEVIQDDTDKVLLDELDDVYWANMKHQYAGMAMQGIMANSLFMPYDGKEIADLSNDIATALVEKLKSENN